MEASAWLEKGDADVDDADIDVDAGEDRDQVLRERKVALETRVFTPYKDVEKRMKRKRVHVGEELMSYF